MMRACMILGVIFVHVVSAIDAVSTPLSVANIGLDMVLMPLHFTREAFMFITGLVLFYTYYHKPFSTTSFWSKRFKLIAIPYVFWTALYIAFIGVISGPGYDWAPVNLLHVFIRAILTGNQYFLYFLVISIQFYFVFPLLLMMMRKLERWHGWVLLVSFLVQLGLMGIVQWVVPVLPTDTYPVWLRTIIHYEDRFVLSYQFWFIAGAVFAVHYERIRTWVLSHRSTVWWSMAAGVAGLWCYYAIARFIFHESDAAVVNVLQPVMVPYAFLVSVTLMVIGVSWARVREERSMRFVSPLVRFFGGASFGIFLVHPIMLRFVDQAVGLLHVNGIDRIPLIPLMAVVTYCASGVVAYCFGKVPLFSYVVGIKTRLPKLNRPDKVSTPA
ncbi:acyltransferase [Alicyclobacillus cycloheptanicus]|uniref:acyltransferase n=1 Tax=Alicyclobacillus cycloheptanicus TaxID=1457 RepID=UPI0027D7D580|nr:acyltransferase [Alicyclobacillus cycloheptanicus]